MPRDHCYQISASESPLVLFLEPNSDVRADCLPLHIHCQDSWFRCTGSNRQNLLGYRERKLCKKEKSYTNVDAVIDHHETWPKYRNFSLYHEATTSPVSQP